MRSTTGSRQVITFLSIALFVISACDTHVRNLGGGFKLVRDARAAASGASAGHHLYYEAKDLGSVGQYFISPSGCHALYEQGGQLMLFHSCSESLKSVTTLDGAVPTQTTWSEGRNEARVTCIQREKELTTVSTTVVPLSACACRVESRPLARAKRS